MMRTFWSVSLLSFLALITDVHLEEIFVRAGDMVVVHCPKIRNMVKMKTQSTWTSYTPHKRILTRDMNSTSGLLLHKRSLILLSTSINQQGNYSCSIGNNTFWFKLSVYTAMSSDDQKRVQYSTKCYLQESCFLHCPKSNSPESDTPNMTLTSITWSKDDKMVFKDVLSFSNVKETDQGTYTCTKSYLYKAQTYNMTFAIVLTVQSKELLPDARLVSPRDSEKFEVNLGSVFVVNCTGVISSEFDDVFWIIENSSVDTNPNSRVFSNYTLVQTTKETFMTALLIFRDVFEKDLSKNYTCKLESVSAPSSLVTISLVQKRKITTLLLPILIVVAMVLVTAVTVLSCIKFKKDIILFPRDQLHVLRKSADVKPYDIYLTCYKSESGVTLDKDDTKWLKDVLEKDFGYKLCLHHGIVPTGETMQKPVLDCIQQSRSVILVPTDSNSGPDCNPVTDFLVLEDHNMCIIVIRTKTEKKSKSSPKPKLQEAFPLLGNTEQRSVTWKGTTSRKQSSYFCKQLRFHLPPPQHDPEDMISEVHCEK